MVVDCDYPLLTAGVRGYGNREDYCSYELSPWLKGVPESLLPGRLIVPADGRTTAAGYLGDPDHYIYWAEGGFSPVDVEMCIRDSRTTHMYNGQPPQTRGG